MVDYELYGAIAALVFALIALILAIAAHKAAQSQANGARWVQAQMERIENEQNSIESALAGLGRHMDQWDQRLREMSQRIDALNARMEGIVAAEAGQAPGGFDHALRLSAQGRVSLDELVQDFGLTESEAQLLLRINQPKTTGQAS
ncbi:DUF2802 domain-containing protein [Halothiobacillus sp. DCM-1]|uniref:DUF2802 domain-containing protein n=1 Tax=Halothiobacillus sp. DCM-1 TaxID=3112558 RepID=UPI0032544322